MKFLQRASNAVSAAASGLLAPGKKKSGKAVAGARRRQYAPELPPEVLHAIFLPLAGDMRTLCAAACVNTSWHTAALHPRLWRKLHADRDGKLVAKTMTDARLAMLVRRACGVDAGGKQHKLVSLRVTESTMIVPPVIPLPLVVEARVSATPGAAAATPVEPLSVPSIEIVAVGL